MFVFRGGTDEPNDLLLSERTPQATFAQFQGQIATPSGQDLEHMWTAADPSLQMQMQLQPMLQESSAENAAAQTVRVTLLAGNGAHA